jgi:hypothetical protein
MFIKSHEYERCENYSKYGQYVALYDNRGNYCKHFKFHYIYELEPHLKEDVDTDSIVSYVPELNFSRVVELCKKREHDEHSVTTLRFLLKGRRTVNSTVLVKESGGYISNENSNYELSLNELLKRSELNEYSMEMAYTLIQISPTLLFYIDTQGHFAMQSLVYHCTLNRNVVSLFKHMCEVLYKIVTKEYNIECNSAMSLVYDTVSGDRQNLPIHDLLIFRLASVSTTLLRRCCSQNETWYRTVLNSEEEMAATLKILKYIFVSCRNIDKYVNSKMLPYKNEIVAFISLKPMYTDSNTSVLHTLLDMCSQCSKTESEFILQVYNLILKQGFFNDTVRDLFITTSIDDNGMTCEQLHMRMTQT